MFMMRSAGLLRSAPLIGGREINLLAGMIHAVFHGNEGGSTIFIEN
jgi:hypothetical protein